MSDKQWWTEQWLDLINSYHFKKRLERGWRYAREGNVLSIEFQDQKVIAKVRGTEPEPYQISLWLDTFSDEDWGYVTENMSQRAVFSAKLLAGEMPQNIEDVFAVAGKRLFPFNLSDIHSQCSCPDKANPCKHISAVYYLLGERFSEDPFVLFQLRGRTKEQILTKLRQLRGKGEESIAKVNSEENSTIPNSQVPIPNSQFPKVYQFWEYNQQLESSLVVIVPPPTSETVLDILGPLTLVNDGDKTNKLASSMDAAMEYLRKIYQDVSQQAVLTALNRGEAD
ncbi:SWIM zinc finger family protein [Kamptonema sp. UHCC 0994]|uniref:SWIM zinc finger family protein n=1 Tax=Kamptonema sp. UHCC 0994 TaxID=3031329 RepID=UPI0023BA2240|nr:SWIM zinc finger family protein [Kamptonema sp. UHCC 0994]MDF0553096.1 SWIM zinc finger family protein [Kamptonema sp. UHCC 0994]